MIQTFVLDDKIGLILNFVGTIMVAFSIGKNPYSDAHTIDDKDNKTYIAYVMRPLLFKVGLGFIAAGFLIQLVCN